MNTSVSPDTLTVLYDGACPLCRREISHVKGLSERRSDSALCFVDISNENADKRSAAERETLLSIGMIKPLPDRSQPCQPALPSPAFRAPGG